MKIILNPLKGIELENGKVVEFGESKVELFNIIGWPSSIDDYRLFYDELELRVDLDDAENIEFIEFTYGPYPEKIEIELYVINPFKEESLNLIELLDSNNNGEIDITEEPYCYLFKESSIGVFRDACEEDVDEMITEMKEMGAYLEHEDWILQDKEKAKYFWMIGLGKKNYYK